MLEDNQEILIEDKEILYVNRDISWLSFNYRVLQEAKDPSVPLYERIKFLAIYSSNLDEYFSVRVASLRNLMRLKLKTLRKLSFDPEILLQRILRIVDRQQTEFGTIYNEQIIPDLEKENIFLISGEQLGKEQVAFVEKYFKEEVVDLLTMHMINEEEEPPFLINKQLYFTVDLIPRSSNNNNSPTINDCALVEIPTNSLPRFLVLPEVENRQYVIFLDDIIRCCIHKLFPNHQINGCYTIKVSRDADLYLGDEFSGNLIDKIRKSLQQRKTGVPSRFLYDGNLPKPLLKRIRKYFDVKKEDLVAGGVYHNYKDFFGFPNPGRDELFYSPLTPLVHKDLDKGSSLIKGIAKKDVLLHFPYQSYDYIVRLLEEAANDINVQAIKISIYRVADDSKIARALIKAAENGKTVTAFVELKARFDEEANLYLGDELTKSGVNVLYSFPNLKVHSKLLLISRVERGKIRNYSYLGTGNFNEKTAKLYCDFGLLTCDKRLTDEVASVFNFLGDSSAQPNYAHLLVAPLTLRSKFIQLIDREIEHAKAGNKASMILKMNSLEDRKMIKKLYEASNAGVKIKLIIRGICCLKPKYQGLSDNIRIFSIVDRFLEHARVFVFHNNGDEQIYVGSADWMRRNLSRRVEVVFPIYNKAVKKELRYVLKLQLTDNVKSRKINKRQNNPYKKSISRKKVRAQMDTYNYLKKRTLNK